MTPTSPCTAFAAQLWDLLDGTLTDGALGPLRAHLDGCPSCAAELDEIRAVHSGLEAIGQAPEAPLPDRIGAYRILRRLGAGGMGVVYEAEQSSPARRVAVKVIRPDGTANESWLRAFRREIEALGRLRHPSIATLYDAGRIETGQLYLVMELVEGERLNSDAREDGCRDRASRRRKVEQIAVIADAIDYAHVHGIVHRDLKPANILIAPDGTPRILDFGLARFLDPQLDVTRAVSLTALGTPAGTLPYISPEHLLGDTTAPAVRGDVYALGVMLYECLTGRFPYEFDACASLLDAQRVVALTEPPNPRARNTTIPRELAEVVAMAVAKDPDRRYESAAELAADLRRYLAGEPVLAHPPSAVHRVRSFVRRRRAVLLVGAAVVLAALLTHLLGPTESPRQIYTTTRFDIPELVGIHLKQIDFDASGRFAVHRIRGSAPGQPERLALWDRDVGVSRPLALPESERWKFSSPRIAPGDPRRIAMLGRSLPAAGFRPSRNGLFVFDQETGVLDKLWDGPNPGEKARDLCWSPDGRQITFVTQQNHPHKWALYDVDLQGARTRWVYTSESVQWELGGYSPDGRWMLFNARANHSESQVATLWVMPARGGAARRLTSRTRAERYARFDPDGRSVWFVSTSLAAPGAQLDANIFRIGFDPESGESVGAVEQVTFHDNLGVANLAFVGDGHDLVCRVSQESSQIYAQTAGTPARPIVNGFQPVPSPDGQTVYFTNRTAEQRGLFKIAVGKTDGPICVARIEEAGEPQWAYHLNLAGDAIVFCSRDDAGPGVFRLTEVDALATKHSDGQAADTGLEPEKLVTTNTTGVFPRWSPDGRLVAYIDGAELFVLDVASGETRQLAPEIWGWEQWTIRWSPDGRSLAVMAYETPEEKNAGSNGVFLIRYPEGEVTRIVPRSEPAYKESLEWHPSGEFLTLVAEGDDHLIRQVFPEHRPTRLLFDDPDHCEYQGIWADHDRFVFQCVSTDCAAGGIHVWDRRKANPAAINASDHPWANTQGLPAWSRQGSTVAWTQITSDGHFELLRGVR